MENIIVLGATGNVGLTLLKHLKGKNVNVYAGVRNESQFKQVEKYGAKPVKVDFTNQQELNEALKGKNRVFLVTPLMQNPDFVTQLVIDAALKNNIKHIVRSTALGADSNGKIQMARWAGKSEDLIKKSGLKYTFIRPNNFLQNFINFHSQTIKEHNGFFLPNGDAKLGMVDTNDIAEIATIALTSDKHYNKEYNLSGLSLTNFEYAELLSDVLGRKISYIDVSEEKAKESMLSNGMPEWLVNAMMELNYIMKQGWTASYSEDYKDITGKEYSSAKDFFEENKQFFN
ncbi:MULTISPECIES: SDR family oxidoreductase [unclassified Tenacibaculum]|uniref:SDR family oxidoreductase n=1 Tax=unclassified Tenacibaculum TaxID=2635139 RepID=UPI001F3B8B5B|nr:MULTISPECIES: SDR family oxidoreductase [unclassified Tenacibaculum]MCF2875812.1 SDR family oxidoreductase [Tenacibaculum sp. Cn5-1]MCF2935887.1 SDR family oxidoreductase [Tenacibaculum sp. Cn5-34]MCG7512448.1 SDR family oxidoreductase [Tenacibaculum sp. Cn5-46]